jgi:putative ABC transport system permease protein
MSPFLKEQHVLPAYAYTFLVLSLGAGLPLLLALATSAEMKVANRFLCISLGSIFYCQAILAFAFTGDLARHPHWIGSAYPVLLASMPSFYLYIIGLTDPAFRLRKRHNVHLIMPLLGLLWYANLQGSQSNDLISRMATIVPTSTVRLAIACVPFGVYLALSFGALLRYRKRLRNYFSDLGKVKLEWLHLILLFFFALWLVLVFDNLVLRSSRLIDLLFPVITIGTLVLGVFAMRQSKIFTEVPLTEKSRTLSEEALALAKGRLQSYLRDSKAYLDPALRLVDLANGIQMKPHDVSEVINCAFGKSFYDLINELRIDEVKKRLSDPKHSHLNILGVAMDSGFNSKSSFNDAFKRLTGMTPREFRSSNP